MSSMNLNLPKLHGKQIELKNSSARFVVCSAGRRFGKTRLLGLLALTVVLDGGTVFWIAPSYKIADVGWRLMWSLAKQIPGAEIRPGDGRITIGKGRVEIRSADSQGGLRGEGLDLVIFDEAAHIKNLKQIWEQEVRAMLSDRRGRAMFISTPKGFNFFYELAEYAREHHTDGWAYFHASSADNPYIDPTEIDAARDLLPELVFRQEYLAEFVNLAGTMFKREYFEIVGEDDIPEGIRQSRHWDLAASTSTQADYSVGCKGGLDTNGNLYITDVVKGRWEWPALIRVIKQTSMLDGAGVVQSIETVGTQKGMLQLLKAEQALYGITLKGITPLTDKITRAQPLVSRAEHGRLRLVRALWNADFINELCAFPEVEHDDQVDSASGMLLSCGMSPVTMDDILRYGTGTAPQLPEELQRYAQGVWVKE